MEAKHGKRGSVGEAPEDAVEVTLTNGTPLPSPIIFSPQNFFKGCSVHVYILQNRWRDLGNANQRKGRPSEKG
ncbi:membrane protein [Sesbania bispinosa]|nr:membrane protein [Sesbania bispinosa]